MKAKVILTLILLTAISAGPFAMAKDRKDPKPKNDNRNTNLHK